jgi:tetratricopeptide (TPR) repeat protein
MNEKQFSGLFLIFSLLGFVIFITPLRAGMIDPVDLNEIKERVSFGKSIYSETEFDAAIAEFEKITRLEPENRKAQEVLKMLKNQSALKRKTNELFSAGQRAAVSGEWLQAAEFFQKALKIEPKNENIKTAYFYARERLVGAKKFSMDFENESLKDILLALGQESGTNIIVPQQMTARVSVHFSDVTLEEALENILKGSDYDVEVSNDFIRIVPKQKKILVDVFGRDEKIINQKWDNIAVQDLIEVLAQMMNVNIIFDPEIKDKGQEKVSLFIKEMTLWLLKNIIIWKALL